MSTSNIDNNYDDEKYIDNELKINSIHHTMGCLVNNKKIEDLEKRIAVLETQLLKVLKS